MACRLVGAKPLSEPMLEYFNSNIRNKFHWNFKLSSYIFIEEKAFENVVSEMDSILSRPQMCAYRHIICKTIFGCVTLPVAAMVGEKEGSE